MLKNYSDQSSQCKRGKSLQKTSCSNVSTIVEAPPAPSLLQSQRLFVGEHKAGHVSPAVPADKGTGFQSVEAARKQSSARKALADAQKQCVHQKQVATQQSLVGLVTVLKRSLHRLVMRFQSAITRPR